MFTPSAVLEHRAEQMAARADALRGVGQMPPAFVLASAIRSAAVFAGRIGRHDQHARKIPGQRDRREILDRVVRHVGRQRDVDAKAEMSACEQRVAVGLGLLRRHSPPLPPPPGRFSTSRDGHPPSTSFCVTMRSADVRTAARRVTPRSSSPVCSDTSARAPRRRQPRVQRRMQPAIMLDVHRNVLPCISP